MSFAKAQERKQKQIQAETLKSLKQQVADLKDEIKKNKTPLRLKAEQLQARILELEKEKLHVELKLGSVQRENAGLKKEVEKQCMGFADIERKREKHSSI